MEHTAFVSIGSNLGDRLKNLTQAVRLLEEHPLVRVVNISHFYETEPVTLRGEKQHWYLNCALKLKTTLNPIRLFYVLQEIEKLMGRTRSTRWAPRTLDLDLLLFDDEIIRTHHLVVPHPRMHERRFILEPLAEIAANFTHPIKGITIKNLLKNLQDNKKVFPLYKFSLSQSSEGFLQTPSSERH